MFGQITKFCIIFYFFLTGITWVGGVAGSGLLGRITVADLFAIILAGMAFLWSFLDRSKKIVLPKEYLLYLPYLYCLVLSCVFALLPGKGIFEVVVHFFAFIIGLSIFNLLRFEGGEDVFSDVLTMVLYAGGGIAAIGLIHFFIFPDWFAGSPGGLSGTFRNTGQAGSYFATFLAIVLPGFFSGFIKFNRLNVFWATLLLLALVFTFKRAAFIGLIFGFCGLLLILLFSKSKKDKKVGVYIFVVSVLIFPVALVMFSWGFDNVHNMAWRAKSKISTDSVQEFADGFLMENIEATVASFSESPIVGVGPANVAGVYTKKYEIHSTYMKVVATTGILGTLSYLLFMAYFSIGVFSW